MGLYFLILVLVREKLVPKYIEQNNNLYFKV